MTCKVCNGTGESTGNGQLDCAAPDCTAALDRANLNAAIAVLPPMTRDDVNWAAYQAGERIAEQRFALERAELLNSMWRMRDWARVWFGIARDADCVDLPDNDWELDLAKANVLIDGYAKRGNPCKS